MKFIEIITLLCAKNKISINKMSKDCGLSSATVSMWKSRGTVPSGETLSKIANYFGVSVDFLLTGQDAPAAENNADDLYNRICALSDLQRQKVIEYIDFVEAKF